MNKTTAWLVVAIVGLAVVTAAGPTLVALVNALVPLALVVGLLAVLIRAAWYFTNRW